MIHQFLKPRQRGPNYEDALLDDLGRLIHDPLDCVYYLYPWREPGGPLEDEDGPDGWQIDFLKDLGKTMRHNNFNGRDPVMPFMASRTTGHGVGKSAMSAWLSDIILSTRPYSKGVMTANTGSQLETKTWAELVRWTNMCRTAHWWKINTGRGNLRMAHHRYPETWRLDGLAWNEHKAEAFAGLHASQGSPFFIFDEASAIPDLIMETAQGGLTDGEPFMFLWGNPTRPSGYFYNTFTKWRKRWHSSRIDSRTAKKTNKQLIEQWREDYGEDSDYFRIRVKGEFPKQGTTQFIPTDAVEAAMVRDIISPSPVDPIVIGVDVARFGDDSSTIYVRQGFDGRSRPPLRFHGVDTMQLSGRVALLAQELVADAIFIDETGVGAAVVDRLNQLNIPRVMGVAFNNKSPIKGYANRAAFMYAQGRDWLKRGGAIPNDDLLKEDLIAREYFLDRNNNIMLEPKDDMKARIGRSPDDGDGLMLTFADFVGPRDVQATMEQLSGAWRRQGQDDYDPLANL